VNSSSPFGTQVTARSSKSQQNNENEDISFFVPNANKKIDAEEIEW